MSSSASSRPTAARETEALLAGPRNRAAPAASTTRAAGSTRWTSTPSSRAGRKLVLVDELAHTNAPGSRHPKRYMDVEELLAAGIDVYTTLNIQHLESLNDVVARITRIRVRETVPDSIIDRADEVEVVDLTPEDLIQRLKEGKVYMPQQAERAIRHYFQPGNLTALRELALRRTAQRVDEQMVDYMRAHAIPGPWAAGERVLVCVNEDPNCARGGALCAGAWPTGCARPGRRIHVETSRTPAPRRGGARPHRRVPAARRAARRRGRDRARRATSPKASSTTRRSQQLHPHRHRQVAPLALVRDAARLGDAAAHPPRRRHQRPCHRRAARGRAGAGRRPARPTTASRRARIDQPQTPIRQSTGMVAAALGIGLVLQQFLAVSNIALVFLTAVLASAIAYGLWPSLFACLVSVLAYNFFFLPPLYTFTIADPENVVALFFFAVVAVIASNLAARVRAQAVTARQRAKTTEELYLFSRKLAGAVTLDDLLWATAYQIALDAQGAGSCCCCPRARRSRCARAIRRRTRWTRPISPRPNGAGRTTSRPAAAPTRCPAPSGCSCRCAPGAAPVGVVGLDSDRPGRCSTPDQRRLLDALADQAALAIERINLAQDVERGAARGRDRAAALGAADLDLARSAHAAGLDPGLGDQPQALSRRARRGGAGRADRARSRTRPSGSTASSPICST